MLHSSTMSLHGAQFRLVARGLVEYLAGIDPSGARLVGTLLTLMRSPRVPGRRDETTGRSEGD
jgi:hypothetical protein